MTGGCGRPHSAGGPSGGWFCGWLPRHSPGRAPGPCGGGRARSRRTLPRGLATPRLPTEQEHGPGVLGAVIVTHHQPELAHTCLDSLLSDVRVEDVVIVVNGPGRSDPSQVEALRATGASVVC